MDFFGKSSAEIIKKIESLEKFVVTDEFGDRQQEAVDSVAKVISQLEMMKTQAEMMEQSQAVPVEEAAPEIIATGRAAIQEMQDIATNEDTPLINQPYAAFVDIDLLALEINAMHDGVNLQASYEIATRMVNNDFEQFAVQVTSK